MDKYGYWIRVPMDKRHYRYICSECKRTIRHYSYPFCPYCGKEMDLSVTTKQKGVYV